MPCSCQGRLSLNVIRWDAADDNDDNDHYLYHEQNIRKPTSSSGKYPYCRHRWDGVGIPPTAASSSLWNCRGILYQCIHCGTLAPLQVMSSSCCNVHCCCLGGTADVVFYQLAVAATVITGTKAVDHEMSFQRSNWWHAGACSSTCSRPEALLCADRRKIRHFLQSEVARFSVTITNHAHG